jgi:hypothetical protein
LPSASKNILFSSFYAKAMPSAYFPSKSYCAVPFDAKYFSQITAESNETVFIDGGNAELIESPTDSLQFIRTAAIKFSGKKRTSIIKKEFYVTTAVEVKGEAFYSAKIKDVKGGFELEIKMNASSISEGGRMQASKMGGIARRVLEIALAKESAEKEKNIIIVLDGTLEAAFPGEDRFLQQLYDAAEKNSTIVVALAKTNTVLATDGRLFAELLENNAPPGAWIYKNVAEITSDNHKAELMFVKLDKAAKHVFRMEIYKKHADEAKKAANALAMTANDLTFPGYPYGLIFADRIARVSENEAEYLKARNSSGRKYNPGINALNAHEILDRM